MAIVKTFLVLIFVFSTHFLFGQNGYIHFGKDSIAEGYLKTYISFMDGRKVVELWKTKKDKNPLKISIRDINGYAIKKDTFKILKQFTPFHNSNLYFEVIEARLKLSGKINLYIIENLGSQSNISTYAGGGLVPALLDAALADTMESESYIYILEGENGLYRAIPSKAVY